jgi:hypothetical protein
MEKWTSRDVCKMNVVGELLEGEMWKLGRLWLSLICESNLLLAERWAYVPRKMLLKMKSSGTWQRAAWRSIPVFRGVSVSSRLHGATFQKANVRGPPSWGTSSRKSLFKIVSFAHCIVWGRYSIGATSCFTSWLYTSHVWGRRLHGYGLYDEQADKKWQMILVR